MTYLLTVGNSNTGCTQQSVEVYQNPRGGINEIAVKFPTAWRKSKTAQHAQALYSAARHLAHSVSLNDVPSVLSGVTKSGDVLPVRYEELRKDRMSLLTTTQAAEQLGITRNAVTRLISAGILPARRIGRDYLIERKHLKSAESRPKAGRPRST